MFFEVLFRAKDQWILDNVTKVREGAQRGEVFFGNIDVRIIWWLIGGPEDGVYVTDYTNGSRTMLMGIRRLDWGREILFRLHIPELRSSSDRRFHGNTKCGVCDWEVPVCSRDFIMGNVLGQGFNIIASRTVRV
ncbi:MAG: FGGY family carbohydrate kinase [Nitrososphaeria archaeon]